MRHRWKPTFPGMGSGGMKCAECGVLSDSVSASSECIRATPTVKVGNQNPSEVPADVI